MAFPIPTKSITFAGSTDLFGALAPYTNPPAPSGSGIGVRVDCVAPIRSVSSGEPDEAEAAVDGVFLRAADQSGTTSRSPMGTAPRWDSDILGEGRT